MTEKETTEAKQEQTKQEQTAQAKKAIVKKYLEEHNIDYKIYEHPAAFTCEESEIICKDVPGLACKNLFLKGKKSKQLYLVVTSDKKKLDLKKLANLLGEKHVGFASAELMQEHLNLKPGSVSPFGLLYDAAGHVKFIIDEDAWNAEIVHFHPNVNTASLVLQKEAFHKFAESLEHEH